MGTVLPVGIAGVDFGVFSHKRPCEASHSWGGCAALDFPQGFRPSWLISCPSNKRK